MPPRTALNANLYTYQDAVERLQAFVGGAGLESTQLDLRQACLEAYDRVGRERDWEYLTGEYRISLEAEVAGTSTTKVTFTASTNIANHELTNWDTVASWASKGRLEIGNVACPIQSTSGQDATMDADVTFPEDIAATAAWKLYRTVYPLPDNFRALYNLEGERGTWVQHYVTPYHWKNLERNYVSPGNVFKFTIMEDKDTYGNLAVYIHGFSNSVDTLDMIMIRYPRPLKYSGLDEDVDRIGVISSSTTTVTGVGTNFSSDMVGSILRWRDTTNNPTGVAGRYPFVGQGVISAVASTTTLTLATAPGTAIPASTKYVITDPVDLHRDLYTSYQRAAEWMLGISRADTRVAMLNGNYREELNKALENGVKIIKKDPYLLYDFTSWEAATFAS